MNGIRRKLRSQRGVTVVFALVIFLIMALFSYVMVNASLTAVQGAHASRVDEQAALSVASASRVMQRVIQRELPGKIQYETNTLRWKVDIPSNTAVNSLLTKIAEALNGTTPAPTLTLKTQSTTNSENPTATEEKIIDAVGDVIITFTAEDNTSGTDIPSQPHLILNFSFLKDGRALYYSNTVITLSVAPNGTIDSVTDMVSTLGQYQAS